MDQLPMDGSGRVRDVQGNVPLHVVIWLEQDPTAALASALAVTAPNVRWHFRVAPTLEVVLRGPRVEVLDARSGERVGSARIEGARSASDFDRLPTASEPPPFTPPEVAYPTAYGFACDLDGRVARFAPAPGASRVGPGLPPRLTSYPAAAPRMGAMVAALASAHTGVAHPLRAFATRVRDLVAVLRARDVVGTARVYGWFEDERVVVWPAASSDLVPVLVSALHARRACLGCSKHDPRDELARGTYAYGRAARSVLESYAREDVPVAPLDVPAVAKLLGRSPAELAATQLNLRFEDALRVDLGRMRLPS